MKSVLARLNVEVTIALLMKVQVLKFHQQLIVVMIQKQQPQQQQPQQQQPPQQQQQQPQQPQQLQVAGFFKLGLSNPKLQPRTF